MIPILETGIKLEFMKTYIILLITLFASISSFSQTEFLKKFKSLSSQAFAEYQNGNYNESAKLNVQSYELLDANNVEGKYGPAYNAACTYALAGKSDKAFEWLDLLKTNGQLKNYDYQSDKDLESLKSDPRWNKIGGNANNSENNMTNKQGEVQEELEQIYKTDQDVRFKLMNLSKESKSQDASKEIKDNYSEVVLEMKAVDAENLEKIKSILSKYGWLGPDEVGFEASQAIFLVIQHADLKTQEQFLPLVRKAAEMGKTLNSNLALMEDRVALRKGDKQIYGSQIWTDPETGEYFVDLLRDPLTVDDRRAKVGLPSMSDYLNQFFGIQWDPEVYQQEILPKLKKRKVELNKSEESL